MTSIDKPSKARTLAEFVNSLTWDAIPGEVRDKAKCHMLDTLGVAIIGATDPALHRVTETLARIDKTRDCTVIGAPQRLSAPNAALMNGMIAHVFDYDDTHLQTSTHQSGVLVPAILAAGESGAADGRSLVTALVAGYEVMSRLGLATRPGQLARRGFHPTSILGGIAGAASVGKLMGLSVTELTDAFGIAASQACGTQQYAGPGEFNDAKRFHSGWPAQCALMAAYMGSSGLTAPRLSLEGPIGLYQTFLAEPPADEAAMTAELGTRWETMRQCPKIHSGCQSNQPYMDLALGIRAKHGLTADQVKRVELKIHRKYLDLCEPPLEKQRPDSPHAALLALQFCVAVVLVKGQASPAEFSEEGIRDEAILKVADRITYSLDEEWIQFPLRRSAWLIIETTDGRRFEERILNNRGSAENPLSAAEYLGKFKDVTAGVLEPGQQDRIAEMVMNVEKHDARKLCALLGATDTATGRAAAAQ